jgi:hypothetical protein
MSWVGWASRPPRGRPRWPPHPCLDVPMSDSSATTSTSKADIGADSENVRAQMPPASRGLDNARSAIVPTQVEAPPLPQASHAALRSPPAAKGTAAAAQTSPAEEPAGLEAGEAQSTCLARGIVYRAIDTALWLLNRPLEGVSAKIRGLIAAVALVTIAISLSAMLLLPQLLPPRDPISQLTRQVAALHDAPATTPPEHSAPPEPAPPE